MAILTAIFWVWVSVIGGLLALLLALAVIAFILAAAIRLLP